MSGQPARPVAYGACRRACLVVLALGVLAAARHADGETKETVVIRGRAQSLRLYGERGGPPVIVSSGDGGWFRLAPRVAEVLSARGFFVVGFDTRAYLESFTSGRATLRVEDEPGDYEVLVDFASRGSSQKPILIGSSEGAGLSVLAATSPRIRSMIAGVIGLGLPDINELGWRFRDALIYFTHRDPREPAFSTMAIADRVSPAPLAAIHSTTDEYVPVSEVRSVLDAAREPKRLWLVRASNHNFSDNRAELDRRLLEAITWVKDHAAR